MLRFVRNLVLVLVLSALVAGGVFLWRSPHLSYAVQERVFAARFRQFDEMIVTAGQRYGVDPKLVKAIVWRESRFVPDMVGGSGERGLMQVTEAAGKDWARAEKIETFAATDLFDPKTNLAAGTWYVSKALSRWKEKDDPLPFALGEYNAGRRRVERWIGKAREGEESTSANYLRDVDFPTTRQYINDVSERYRFYQKRGRL